MKYLQLILALILFELAIVCTVHYCADEITTVAGAFYYCNSIFFFLLGAGLFWCALKKFDIHL